MSNRLKAMDKIPSLTFELINHLQNKGTPIGNWALMEENTNKELY